VTVLKKLLAIKPEYKNAKVALAYAYLNLKEPDKAVILLEEARVKDPDNIFLLRNLGSLYAQKGEYERDLNIYYLITLSHIGSDYPFPSYPHKPSRNIRMQLPHNTHWSATIMANIARGT